MAQDETGYAIVLTTAGSEEQAEAIARMLVDKRLAACVNVAPQIKSFYRWKGKVVEDEEFLLVIKTEAALFDRLREAIREVHSYEMPDILLIPVAAGDPAVLGWITESVG
jgi:periplasmic divalent cation tolerance protein